MSLRGDSVFGKASLVEVRHENSKCKCFVGHPVSALRVAVVVVVVVVVACL